MKRLITCTYNPVRNWMLSATLVLSVLLGQASARAFNLEVVDRNGSPVAQPFRWLLEEDTTTVTVPGTPTNNSISLVISTSHAPVAANGEATANPTVIVPPDPAKRYVVSVMKGGYALGAAIVTPGQANVRVILNPHALPTAQISVFAFHDNNPINNAPEAVEQGLGGFKVVIDDAAMGGPMLTDAFGNPLGTTYQFGANDEPLMVDGVPVVAQMGNGEIYTDADGKALIKYIAPGKYGVRVIPPTGTRWAGGHGAALVKGVWNQTATIEGTLTVDAWVKANEPSLFLEGFGPGFFHVFFGFVDPGLLPWETNAPTSGVTLIGTNRFNHFGRPPTNQMFAVGPVVDQAWVGLNEIVGGIPGRGLYAAPCNADGSFSIANIPPGTYQLVTWDKPLDALFGFNTITVAGAPGSVMNLGNVLSYRWFGTLEGTVFYDADQDGFRDPVESGIPLQNINLRFRDGRVYMATATDLAGDYGFAEVFPFFKWLVTEVDFARLKATGMTAVVDEGGSIPPDNGWAMPSEGVRNPQRQYNVNADGVAIVSSPIINPNTGNNLSRTEVGPVLTEAMHLFLNQNNRIDWGKANYGPGENGGISGIVFYSTTRAEEDPRNAVGDGWEPGIPRVQVALYRDARNAAGDPIPDKIIDDINGNGVVDLPDVDNHPLGWATGQAARGPEDVDQDGDGLFDAGDAINVVWSDSWDDNMPGSMEVNPPVLFGKPIVGADNYSTWNQIRPGVFDGGYAFNGCDPVGWDNNDNNDQPLIPGTYIVHAVPPPGYLIQTEESLNVVFGDAFQPSTLALLPECVGTPANGAPPHVVPPYLTLFPEEQVPAPFAGQQRPLADRKWVRLAGGQNAAADFHMYTEVPKAARVVGFVLNDFTAEFNAFSPIFGEKGSPGWLPVSFRDWAGNEVTRVYSDEYGSYNAMVPSTYTVNVPSPSGVSPNMLTLILNDPTMPDPADLTGQTRIPDPFYNPNFATTPWTFMYYPASVSYLDTPIVPIAGLVGFPNKQLDTEPPDGTPVIKTVSGTGVGPYIANNSHPIVITSLGTAVAVPDPRSIGYQANATINRDFGFGNNSGGRSATISSPLVNNGQPAALIIDAWNPNTITARVQPGTSPGEYQLLVTRNNGITTRMGVTLTVGPPSGGAAVHYVTQVPSSPGDPFPNPIQDAIDAAAPNDLILVGPGNFNENVVLWKPLRLQGSGVGTVIEANPNPLDRVATWHAYVTANMGGDPFLANELPGIMVYSTNAAAFTLNNSRIDGFQIRGAVAGGGIGIFNNVHNLGIRNNRITGNQGSFAGGICLGVQGDVGILYDNSNVTIERNEILKNGGVRGAGGISLYTGATGYRILKNYIMGNFCRANGGGIAHEGLSPNGLIADNVIAFNEVFYGVAVGGDGGGIYIAGEAVVGGLGTGAGSVTILNNLIQGNLAGSGHGGGIRVASMNGNDVLVGTNAAGQLDPNRWYALDIINNIIVNNAAGWAGGGVSLQDVTRARLVHNTIARNDSAATSRSAFRPGQVNSDAQIAGLACHQHSVLLAALVAPQNHSRPGLTNNIIHGNNSYYWNGTTQRLVASAPGGSNARRDLGVVEQTGTRLTPQYCVLRVAHGNGAGNIIGSALDFPLFIAPYTNTLNAAAIIDEAGNNISLRLHQLVPAGATQASYGDYHISNTSPGRNLGLARVSPVNYDFDEGSRPGGSNPPDIGADEFGTAAVVVAFTPTAPLAGPPASGIPPAITTPPIGPGTPPGPPVPFVMDPPPGDTDWTDSDLDGDPFNDHVYARLSGGDGFSRMADGNELYGFGFSDLSAVHPTNVMAQGTLKAEFSAPTLVLKEGQKFYLDLSNVGMLMRPDLFDPHTVHFHGYPQAASIFDGEPFASIAINVGGTLRYFYQINHPGTYLYHCHVEATEHMEMGMLGNLYVLPKQNYLAPGTPLANLPPGKGTTHQAGYKYVYNDGDGSTYYDVEQPLQFGAVRPVLPRTAYRGAAAAVRHAGRELPVNQWPRLP